MTIMHRRLPTRLMITCEHGGNEVPEELRTYFANGEARQHLHSHRGYDPGALAVARRIAESSGAPLEFSTVSRLVVDLNRSLDSPELLSKFLVSIDEELRRHVLEKYYYPYRERVADSVKKQVDAGESVLHLSVHTFTPRFRGSRRRFDIGVLFDPGRESENRHSLCLIAGLAKSGLRVLPNQPYHGIDDGLTTELRKHFDPESYLGIELELNNRIDKLSEKTRSTWVDHILAAIDETGAETGIRVEPDSISERRHRVN
jgi:predicted N-formylglutamate amidohydrolase